MQVKVKFFALFREMVGIKEDVAQVPEGTTVEGLWKQYTSKAPRLANVRSAYAVNQRLAKADAVLQDGDEVGFLPPVSGGQPVSKSRKPAPRSRTRPGTKRKTAPKEASISKKKLDLAALIKQVEFSGAGAIVTFTGVVRDNSNGREVDHLEYEAYGDMAEGMMRDIIAEIKERWSEVRVVMAHRIGRLKIGEASLIIAVSAPHRPEAFLAARYAIERVKAVLPVWKKEFATDGESWVEGPLAGELPPDKAESTARDAEYTPF